MLSMYADDAVFDFSALFTDVEPVRGHENMARYWMELRETWEGIGLEPVEGFVVDDRRFVLVMRLLGVGKRSGAGVEQRIAALYTVGPEDDKIVHAQFLPDVAAAMSAAESSADQPV
jgi:ketosteroid isomerase-like protein